MPIHTKIHEPPPTDHGIDAKTMWERGEGWVTKKTEGQESKRVDRDERVFGLRERLKINNGVISHLILRT